MKIEVEPTVIIVDDDISARRSAARLMRAAGFDVVTHASAKEFLEHSRPEGPACLVLDVRMPGLSGMDLQRAMAKAADPIPIIFVTAYGDIPMSVRAMKEGAVEFLTKPYRSRSLLSAVRDAITRDRMAEQKRLEDGELRKCYARLTPREREVMALIVTGLLNKQAASTLATTERTIKFHRAHIMKKMGADSLASLVRMAEKLEASRSG